MPDAASANSAGAASAHYRSLQRARRWTSTSPLYAARLVGLRVCSRAAPAPSERYPKPRRTTSRTSINERNEGAPRLGHVEHPSHVELRQRLYGVCLQARQGRACAARLGFGRSPARRVKGISRAERSSVAESSGDIDEDPGRYFLIERLGTYNSAVRASAH